MSAGVTALLDLFPQTFIPEPDPVVRPNTSISTFSTLACSYNKAQHASSTKFGLRTESGLPSKSLKEVKDDPKIAQPEACDLDIVPKVAFRWMFSGPSNSGKTNLARWVLDKYYIRTHGKTFFDRIYLFSPTGKLDPVWKDLDGCRPSDRITELTAHGKERLHDVFDAGLRRTKAMGKDKAPHELVIFDDAIADVKFLNSADFLKVFVAGRHGNISCMVMTQSYVKVPRSVRMQITALAMFPSRVTEIERLCDEHGPVDNNCRNEILLTWSSTLSPKLTTKSTLSSSWTRHCRKSAVFAEGSTSSLCRISLG